MNDIERKPDDQEGLTDGLNNMANAVRDLPKNAVTAVSEEWQLVKRSFWVGNYMGLAEGVVLMFVLTKFIAWLKGEKV